MSDQAVRRMINKYTALAAIDLHITPHMFRRVNKKHKQVIVVTIWYTLS